MKRTTVPAFFSFVVIVLSTWFSACDKISEPFIKPVTIDTTDKIRRKILIEDFTGFKCINCPTAQQTAHEIQYENPKSVVILSIHAGDLAVPSGGGLFTYDFRTSVGNELNTFFKIGTIGYPNGLVNRIMKGVDDYIIDPAKWRATVDTMLDDEPILTLDLAPTYNAGSREVSVDVNGVFLKDFSPLINVCAFITEDSIIQPQMNNNPDIGPDIIQQYVHMHVLRGSLNGTWGSAFTSAAVLKDTEITKTYTGTLDPAWNDHHCSLIVFAYRTDNLEIIQVEQKVIQ